MMKSRPEFVYFDLGNVLCFFDHAISAKQMAAVAGSTAEEMRRLVFESELEHRYETGLISGEEFVAEIAASLGREIPTEPLLEAASAIFRPNLDILSVLEAIREQGIPMGLLSNTNEAHWKWIERQNYPVVKDWFDPVILSYEVKAMKPASLIYRHATERAGVSAERIFFTDDRLDNVEGAQRAGWQVFQFKEVDSLLRLVQGW